MLQVCQELYILVKNKYFLKIKNAVLGFLRPARVFCIFTRFCVFVGFRFRILFTMNLLAWNCRGIANRTTRHALKTLITKHQIHLVFLCETHCFKQQHETLPKALGLPHLACFDRVNQSGGVALLWDDSVTVHVRKTDYFFIDVDLSSPGVDPWRFTGFYGHPETGQRHISWDLLRSLVQPTSPRWVVMGDFNEILSLNEKSGGPLRNNFQMQAFRGAISDCNLEDMGAVGGPFTWCNSNTKERLDRGLASSAWRDVFPFSRVVHLAPSKSDHIPLLLEIRAEPQTLHRRRRLFRFEEIWSSHSSFPQVGISSVATLQAYQGYRVSTVRMG